MGPEWTNKGWIFDPHTNSVNKKPNPGMIAAFRWVINEK